MRRMRRDGDVSRVSLKYDATVWQIWPHECTEWQNGSKKSSAHNEASPWSGNRVAPSSPPGEIPVSCMPRSLLVQCHLWPKVG